MLHLPACLPFLCLSQPSRPTYSQVLQSCLPRSGQGGRSGLSVHFLLTSTSGTPSPPALRLGSGIAVSSDPRACDPCIGTRRRAASCLSSVWECPAQPVSSGFTFDSRDSGALSLPPRRPQPASIGVHLGQCREPTRRAHHLGMLALSPCC